MMINKFIGIEYGRGGMREPCEFGTALAPAAIQNIFPDSDWTIVKSAPFDIDFCRCDRFGENYEIQKLIYNTTPRERHILIGGDHSVNFGHFAAIADQMPNDDLCLIYMDAHLDIHNPASTIAQASGAPHGTNVRALMGDGDSRWLSLMKKCPALKSENLFYIGTRSYEPAEINYVNENNIWIFPADALQTHESWTITINKILKKIGNRPFVLSVDFDVIDPSEFGEVQVPEPGGISVNAAQFFINEFAKSAHSIEFVEYAPSGDENSAAIVKTLIGLATQ